MLLAFVAIAQETVFTTKVSATKAGALDAFHVSYEIKNAGNVSKFLQPNFTGFNVLQGPSQSSNISMFNGDISQVLSFTYLIQCKKTGTVTIPSAGAIVDGKTIKSNTTSIEIVNGSIAKQVAPRPKRNTQNPLEELLNGQDPFEEFFKDPNAQNPFSRNTPNTPPKTSPTISKDEIAKSIFIKVEVDKKEVELGEQLTANYKLYTRIPMQMNLSKLPSLNGFWSQDFAIPNPPTPTREIVNGVEYQVFLIKKSALFPTQTGTLLLDEAEAEGTARIVKTTNTPNPLNNVFDDDATGMQGLINSFFRNGLGSNLFNNVEYEDVPLNIKSQPVTITVKELPKDLKPSSFNGAVGNFTIESNIDKTELTTDQTATITLTVRGTGNLKLIGAPTVQFPADFDSYDPVMKDTITSNDNTIAGFKTFKYTCAPTIAGEFTIPQSSFSYYDPASKSFKTLVTPTYTLHVKEGKNYTSQNHLPKDIHDIQSRQIPLQKEEELILPNSSIYWGSFALPLMALIAFSIYKRKETNLKQDKNKYKQKQANKIALKRLSTAKTYLQQQLQKPFYEEVAKAMWLYISDKSGIPISNLSKGTLEQYLTQKEIDTDTRIKLMNIIDECEIALYSRNSNTTRMQECYDESIQLIGVLEDKL